MKPVPITAVRTLRIFRLFSLEWFRKSGGFRIHFIIGFEGCYTVVLAESMVVKIRLSYGSTTRKTTAVNRQAALAVSSLMTPVAVMAGALACWRIAADLRWAGEFAIPKGLFSHWQVWIAVAIVVQFAAYLLHRFARREEYGEDDTTIF
jgi:hypothetical protein